MPTVTANGIEIAYEITGDRAAEPLLLIMGLGGQLIAWDRDFVAALVARGFRVIYYDNRDVGLSTWFDDRGVPDIRAAYRGRAEPAYLLADMADDAAGLLDALGIDTAHVFGVSMGGMIAQCLALQHPPRVRTLVSVMSTTGNTAVGAPHESAIKALMAPPPMDRESAIETSLASARVLGSPDFPRHEDRLRARAGAAYDRAFHPEGIIRQMVGIVASPDRTPGLSRLRLPTLVIHGDSDPLVDSSGGKATAAAVPGASLWCVPGMGHDLPPELFDEIADRVARLCLS